MAADDFAITIRCTGCGEGRPVSHDPCPVCGAPPYRDEPEAGGEPGSVGDGDGPPFE